MTNLFKSFSFFTTFANFRIAKQEILALSQMAEQINSKLNHHQNSNYNNNDNHLTNGNTSSSSSNTTHQHSNESVDLDNLFAFLSEVQPNSINSNTIIDEIGENMDTLVGDLDIELESVIQQEIEGLTNERYNMPSNKVMG